MDIDSVFVLSFSYDLTVKSNTYVYTSYIHIRYMIYVYPAPCHIKEEEEDIYAIYICIYVIIIL